MATYMSHEETIPLIRTSVFNNFTFYTDEDIKAQIHLIPDNPYGQLPPGVTPEQGALAKEQRKGEHPLTSKEKANQNKYAEALCLRDNRKASGIAHYINNILNREIDTSKQSSENRNCAYGSALVQISNKDYLFDPQSGAEYSDYDFRKQVIFHMATNYEALYGLVKIHLDVPYKQWLTDQMDPMEDGDMVSLIGIRHLLNVSTPFLHHIVQEYNIIVPDYDKNVSVWLYRISLNC